MTLLRSEGAITPSKLQGRQEKSPQPGADDGVIDRIQAARDKNVGYEWANDYSGRKAPEVYDPYAQDEESSVEEPAAEPGFLGRIANRLRGKGRNNG